MTGQEKVTF